MIPLDIARKYRDKRHEAQEQIVRIKQLPHKIASRLECINYDDMSTAERQIADLLGHEGYLFFNEEGDCRTL